jgi:hypothetical protein
LLHLSTDNMNNQVRIEKKRKAHVSMGCGICSALPRCTEDKTTCCNIWQQCVLQ